MDKPNAVTATSSCLGDTIAFTLNTSKINYTGCQERDHCDVTTDFGYHITWQIIKPDNTIVSGSGPVATVTADVPGTYVVVFTVESTGCPLCPPVSDTVYKSAGAATVDFVEWKAFSAASTPLDTCPNNGGTRMFPGKQSPNDASASIRTKVLLEATVTPVVEGCTVYFKNWDVDDPFDQSCRASSTRLHSFRSAN